MILFHRKAAVLYTNRILYNHSRPSAPGRYADWSQHLEHTTTQALQAAQALAREHKVKITGLSGGPASFPCATRQGMLTPHDLHANSAWRQYVSSWQKP